MTKQRHLSEKIDLKQEDLRYLRSVHHAGELSTFQDVKFTFHNDKNGACCGYIEGQNIFAVTAAKNEMEKLVDSLTKTSWCQDFSDINEKLIVDQLQKQNVNVGWHWSKKTKKMFVCSDSNKSIDIALNTFKQLSHKRPVKRHRRTSGESLIDDHKKKFKFSNFDNPKSKSTGSRHSGTSQQKAGAVASTAMGPVEHTVHLEKLRFFSATCKEFISECKRNNVDISINFGTSSISVFGHQQENPLVLGHIMTEINKFFIKLFPISDVFMKCFQTIRDKEITSAFKRSSIVAGWDVREGNLHVCSQSVEIAQSAWKIIKGFIIESQYPKDGSLSSLQKQAVENRKWKEFVDQTISHAGIRGLQIQYVPTLSKIQFSLREPGNSNAVVKALEKFFKSFEQQEVPVEIADSQIVTLFLLNWDYVTRQCSDDGSIIFDEKDLKSSKICRLRSQNFKALKAASKKLTELVQKPTRKTITFSKLSEVAWLKCSTGKTKIEDIEKLTSTVSSIGCLNMPGDQPLNNSLPLSTVAGTATAKDVFGSSSSLDNVIEMFEIVKEDITLVEVRVEIGNGKSAS